PTWRRPLSPSPPAPGTGWAGRLGAGAISTPPAPAITSGRPPPTRNHALLPVDWQHPDTAASRGQETGWHPPPPGATRKAMHISVYPGGGGRYYSRVRRQDGVVLHLPGYDRKWSVPHDLAHFAAERAFGWTGGLWGSIAAGAELPNMHVISGRPRHDHRARSDAILPAHPADLGIAGGLAGLPHARIQPPPAPTLASLFQHSA